MNSKDIVDLYKVKASGSMVLRQVFLKRKMANFATFFFQGLSFLHLEIILLFEKLCYTFEEK